MVGVLEARLGPPVSSRPDKLCGFGTSECPQVHSFAFVPSG